VHHNTVFSSFLFQQKIRAKFGWRQLDFQFFLISTVVASSFKPRDGFQFFLISTFGNAFAEVYFANFQFFLISTREDEDSK